MGRMSGSLVGATSSVMDVMLGCLVALLFMEVAGGAVSGLQQSWDEAPRAGTNRRLLSVNTELREFFGLVSSEQRVDLVLLLDRSHSMTAYTFYTVQKQLIEDMLRYYVTMATDQVRLAVLTFGSDGVTTVFDAIASSGPHYKCQLFIDPPDNQRSYWGKVLYRHGAPQGVADIADALQAANAILASSTATDKRVLVTWDGVISNNTQLNEIMQAKTPLEDAGVELYVLGCGPESVRLGGNMQQLASSVENYGEYDDWLAAMDSSLTVVEKYKSNKTFVQPPSLNCVAGGQCDLLLGYRECLCDGSRNPCYIENLGDSRNERPPVVKRSCADNPCIVDQGKCEEGNDTWVCLCEPGYSGRFCEVNDNECDYKLCRNGATCRDGINDVTCFCAPTFCGDLCIEDTDCPLFPGVVDVGVDLKVILLACVPTAVVLLVLLGVCIWTCNWISTNVPEDDVSGAYDSAAQQTTTPPAQNRYSHSTIRLPSKIQVRRTPAEIMRRLSKGPYTTRPLPTVPANTEQARTSTGDVNNQSGTMRPTDGSVMPVRYTQVYHTSGGQRHDVRPQVRPKPSYATSPHPQASQSARGSDSHVYSKPHVPSPPPLKRHNTTNSTVYQNVPVSGGMETWSEYLLEMTATGEIDHVCIVKMGEEQTMWIASSKDFHVTDTQVYQQVLSKRLTDINVGIRQVIYTIHTNDGTMLTALSGNNVALCVAKTDEFLIFAKSDQGNVDLCKAEVMRVYEHMGQEGM